MSEAMHFLVEVKGFFAGDTLCMQLISHLQKHCENILKGMILNLSQPNITFMYILVGLRPPTDVQPTEMLANQKNLTAFYIKYLFLLPLSTIQ